VINGIGRQFEAAGLARSHWSNATPIRAIFRGAFALAGLPYFNPHSFRKTIVQLGEQLCSGPEEFKAWSQNLGHDDVMVTYLSYGKVPHFRQVEIFRGLHLPRPTDAATDDVLRTLEKILRSKGTLGD
jgi:integrase/recombinase XerD